MADAEQKPKSVGFFGLFRFADKIDVLVMLVGTLCMSALAVAIPLNIYFFGDLVTEYVVFDTPRLVPDLSANVTNWTKCSLDHMTKYSAENGGFNKELAMAEIVYKYSIAFSLNGVVGFIVAYLGITLWQWTGERQICRVRTAYFGAVMKQSVGWFDVHKAGEINSHLAGDIAELNQGFGKNMATFIQWVGAFIGCYVMSFLSGWKLTLAAVAAGPILIIVTTFLTRFTRTLGAREQQAHARAGAVAEETFSSIRTVAAFGGEKKAEEKYINNLQDALKEGVRKATVGGVNGGMYHLVSFCLFALCLWFGAKLAREECLDAGVILQVFWGVLIGSLNLGYAIPVFQNFSNARAAAAVLFQTIDAPVEIDSSSENGLKPQKLDGNIEFVNVGFSYPSRREAKALKSLSFSARTGERVALVGETGSGKSTAVRLIQRFYDCTEGTILIDGKDLRDYNLTWLRNYMGIVSQEPVLFATTIEENIRLGSKYGDEVTQEEIETAAKQANCYDFITKLPEGFNTFVGERGVQLSGGQKQRIAIARALVRNPAILLLDEATSALDTQSEAIVQDALDKASKGRTTLVIAHRLSTVKGADKIYAFKDGQVYEEGTHDQLMSKEGLYHSLVMRQIEKEKKEVEQRQRDQEKLSRSQELPRLSDSGSIHSMSDTAHTAKNGSQSILRTSSPEKLQMEELDMRQEPQETVQLLQSKNVKKEAEIKNIEILAMNGPEWPLLMTGTFSAIVVGTIQLLLALIMSEVVGKLSEPIPEVQEAEMARYTIYILLTGVMAAAFTPLQSACWALSGERMTMRLRKQAFAATVKQEVGYFDDERNSTAFLTSRISSDAPKVKGATGIRIGVITQCLTTTVGVLIISFAHVWELALATLPFIPIMLVAGKVQQTLSSGYAKQMKDGIDKGGKMAQEAISNMSTVTSLNRQRYFTDKFSQHFKKLCKDDTKTIFSHGIEYGVAQSMLFFLHALCFGFGSYLVICDCLSWRTEKIPFYYVLRVFSVVTFGSMSVGRAIASLPDYASAKLAAGNIKKLLDRQSAIDPTSTAGVKNAETEGTVKFVNVEFSYPTRDTAQVLQGVSFTVKKGETLALVGSSGCGKSTSVSLLERFYDCTDGAVTFDGKDVKSLNIQWLRHNLGLVSQEPTLFDASIAENIAYGDNTREIPMAEIIQAATKANAHNFITSLPDGYETNVGAKGTQLSGGQKQRIAIARALVRNPAVLLLDEATSALDTENEKIVQEALDKALIDRTAIVIAHRLSTVRNADHIAVIDSGKIVEVGTHDQLIEKKGFYFDLVNAQL